MTLPTDAAARAYARYWEELSPDTVGRLDAVAAADIRFKDPFNDFRGRDRLRAVLERMFTTLERPRFVVTDTAPGARATYLRWRFDFALSGRPQVIEGMSEVRFGADGLAVEHVDHWDAGEYVYEKVPLLGGLVRLVRRRLAH